jgi:hypothetical protein
MAVWEPGDSGTTRGGTPVERYVRELLRDAERMRRSSRPRGRFDAVDAADRPPIKSSPRLSPERATDDHPPVV